MAPDILINIVNSVIVFTCPSCGKTGGFGLEEIRKMGRAGESAVYPCGHCGAEASFDSATIEGTVRLMKKDNPGLRGPFGVKFEEASEIRVRPVGSPGEGGKGAGPAAGDHGVIVVIDSDESYRKDVQVIFEGLARVKAYGGSKGAVDFIKKWAQEAILMIIDVYLGDGTFIDVLGGLKESEEASKISTIVVHPTRKDRAIIEQMVLPYPQVKRIIHKDELLKRLSEVAEKFPKKG